MASSINQASNVQSLKVRRLQQGLLLREMEHLADALCQARAHAEPISSEKIRADVEAIHSRVHRAIQSELLQQDKTRQSALTDPHPPATLPQSSLRSKAQPLPLTPRHTASDEKWTAQEARGVAARLRRFVPMSLGAEARRVKEAAAKPAIEVPGDNPMHIMRFQTDEAAQVALLDINMDNNTTCLSSRRPALLPVELAMRDKVRSTLVKPVPPLRLEWLDHTHSIDRPARISSSSRPSALYHSARYVDLALRSSRGASWSPRDAVLKQTSLTGRKLHCLQSHADVD